MNKADSYLPLWEDLAKRVGLKAFSDYHIVDLLRLSTSTDQVSRLDAEEMQELIATLAERVEDCHERLSNYTG